MIRPRYVISAALAAIVSTAAALALALAVGGCAAERTVLTLDPSLTGSSLHDGGLAILGVTMVDEVEQVRPPLERTLTQILESTHPGIAIRTAAAVQETLGVARTRALLNRYQQSGSLDAVSLAAIADRLEGAARYAVVARVLKTSIHLPGRPRPAEVRYGTLESSWRTRRDAQVQFTVYDLRERGIALESTYASSSENALPDSLAYRRPEGPAPEITGMGGEAPPPPDSAPETPSVADAIVEACRAFATDLPGGNR
jgi:hypothetical protein